MIGRFVLAGLLIAGLAGAAAASEHRSRGVTANFQREHPRKCDDLVPVSQKYLGDLSRHALVKQHDKIRRLHRTRAPLERQLP